jgi:Membrane bound O-acyl transferase family
MNRPGGAQTPIPWWHGWAPLLLLPAGVTLLAPSVWPRWVFMWTLAGSIYIGCKWLTWRRTPTHGVPYWKHAGYLLAWPGLDAVAFLTSRSTISPTSREWAFGAAKFALGVALFLGATRIKSLQAPYLIGWIGMVGIVLMLHFGLFHLLSCAWRHIGVDARPLMDWPLKSTSLSEFWGRRWNTAFRDLTHRFLFRPLTRFVGPRGAIFGGFVFSGIVHDVVISMPSRGGYGGPTLFFTIQAAGMLVERTALGKRLGLGRGWNGWLFTLVVLVAPVYWLFHPPFVEGIVVPFMKAVADGL